MQCNAIKSIWSLYFKADQEPFPGEQTCGCWSFPHIQPTLYRIWNHLSALSSSHTATNLCCSFIITIPLTSQPIIYLLLLATLYYHIWKNSFAWWRVILLLRATTPLWVIFHQQHYYYPQPSCSRILLPCFTAAPICIVSFKKESQEVQIFAKIKWVVWTLNTMN